MVSAFQFVLNIVYPFLLGGAIAFALSVPMNFVERKLFTERKISEKYKRKYARGISLMLVIAGVTGILAMIIFGLLPQLEEHLPIWERVFRSLSRRCRGGQITGSIIIKKL